MKGPERDRIATICARGGSKGLPGKNMVELDGEPLVARAIQQARESAAFAVIAVSSDDPKILEVAQKTSADLLVERPASLASDTASKIDAIRHAVVTAEGQQGWRFDTVVDLDVSTPLRQPSDIVAVVEDLEDSSATIVLTATPADRSPYFNLVEVDEEGVVTLPCGEERAVRRQDSPPVFALTGAVYAWQRAALEMSQLLTPGTRLHLLPRDRAWDIDEPWDLQVVRCLSSSVDPEL